VKLLMTISEKLGDSFVEEAEHGVRMVVWNN
jgi:hypothetical protein